jgi:hypothetical protein
MGATPIPDGFNPDECPILSVHFFGLQPCPQANDRQAELVGPIVDNIVGDLSFQRDIERLHRLGPRPQYELLREIEQRFGCGNFIRDRVKRFAELDPELVQAVGGDRFPEAPVHEVRR